MTQQELELPKGWAKSQFDKCISYIIGGDWGEPFKDKVRDNFVKVRVLRSTELKNWKKESGSTAETRIIKKSSLDKRQLHDGNIILEISGGGTTFPVGRSVLIDNSILKNFDVPIICSNFFRKITLEEFLDPVYASNFLDYNYSTGLTIKFKKQSVNIQNLNTSGYLSSLLLPIPPLNEQKRIITKIEELFSKIDSTKKSLEHTKLQLEQYRHSLLKSAFEGKLTEEWGRTQSLLSKETILEKILESRTTKENLKFKNISPETTDLPYAVKTWVHVYLDSLLNDARYGTSEKCYTERKEIPVIRIPNIISGKLEFTNLKFANINEKTMNNLEIKNGDLLVCRSNGSIDIIGKTAIAENLNEKFAFASYLIRLRIDECLINPKYLNYLMSSLLIRNFIMKNARTTAGQYNINLQILRSLIIPVCDLKEQEQIITKIEQGFSLIENSQRIVNSTLQTLKTMRMSVLKQAFQGKLVPQDPNDEPAEILLERIKNR